MKTRMFIVGRDNNAAFEYMGFKVVNNPFDADILQFMGGEDVTPELYGEKNTNSYNNFDRDINEMGWFHYAQMQKLPCVGICRGGQFLNVMCGGKMIQDVSGHTRDHVVVTLGYGDFLATSTHHQQMVAGKGGSVIGVGDADSGTEIVLYKDKKVLCFQPHPEYDPEHYQGMTKAYVGMINDFLLT